MRKIALILGVGVLGFLTWYLGIRSYEFSIRFAKKTIPGVVDQTLKIWERSLPDSEVQGWSEGTFIHTVKKSDHEYQLRWVFEATEDSTTRVRVLIHEPGQGVKNKLLVPFTRSRLEVISEDLVRNFITALSEHLRLTRVKVTGWDELPAMTCLCIHEATNQLEKAQGMMRNYVTLSTFVSEQQLSEPGVTPLVEVTSWDRKKDQLEFNFCFPVSEEKELPEATPYFYRKLPARAAIKAVYNGNYITSDRAWYALLSYAKQKGMKVDGEPVEFFFNNPNFGGNETDWKAEVYVPIKY